MNVNTSTLRRIGTSHTGEYVEVNWKNLSWCQNYVLYMQCVQSTNDVSIPTVSSMAAQSFLECFLVFLRLQKKRRYLTQVHAE